MKNRKWKEISKWNKKKHTRVQCQRADKEKRQRRGLEKHENKEKNEKITKKRKNLPDPGGRRAKEGPKRKKDKEEG